MVLATLPLLVGALAPLSDVRAEYGDIAINNFAGKAGMRPVVFPHWFHRIRYTCKVCHADLKFEMKAGGNNIKMVDILEGRFCGTCHNGEIAWGIDNCDLCHSAKPKTETQLHHRSLPQLAREPGGDGNKAAASLQTTGTVSSVNQRNRLLRTARGGNMYDTSIEAATLLQRPSEAFSVLPKTMGGNRVDWGKALANGDIKPQADLSSPDAPPVIMDLNIVREVTGSMPDVVFPHKQHTQWLDCSNCHPAIFMPQKGSNPLSMAANLQGKQCGTCHGKVAFPLSRCVVCHSKKKEHSAEKVREWVVK